MLTFQHIPHIFTAFAILIMAIVVVYLIRIAARKDRLEKRFEAQLQFTLNPEREIEPEKSKIEKKLEVLPEMLIKSGIVEPDRTIEDLKRKLFLGGSLIFLIVLIMSRNIIIALFPPIIVYYSIYGWAYYKISKIKALMEQQIPSFVSTFKANVQANQHPQNAMINAINDSASPLYDQLVYPKEIMEAGEFRPGIIALRKSTDNETLRHMSTCIELASASGSNLVKQLEVVESIIQDKQEIERKKKLGVNENKPLFFVSALFVPLVFIGTMFLSEIHRTFWFKSTLSWVILIFVAISMIVAVWATWKVIQKVEIA